ncbi:PDZ and LIM domain protein Zasp isoform X1 [Drosophila busckii]|uniref:PDZ and LIM domain protein Zasp isoform X1 n=1 Tax=Drosophila busckii TaxID=30019 RepID=UPI00083F2B6B|nr:PDZ and LIM domain protein Zasp isoform X1 [Drosophila busckii]
MAQPQMLQVKLSRFDAQPWGFRLQGGVDFAQPLLVQKVNAGSLSEQAGLQPGDAVIKINDVDVFSMRHKDAQDIVVRSGNNFVITVQRGGSTWRPHVTPTGNVPQANSPYLQTVTKTSLAHHQQDSQHIGCGYNNSARPFGTDGGDGVKSIVNKQYNTPVGIYSDESIAETLSAQAEVLAGGVLGVNFKKNEKEYQADRSEVLKFLREEETGQSTPAFGQNNNNNGHYEHDAPQQQHHHQHQHQHQHQQHQHQQQQQQQVYQSNGATRHVSAPVNTPKPPSTGGLPTGQNICTECERLITGVFVRIKDKNLHVECFKCATCGTSLKNQGYYNFNNKLYCDIHAKQAAQSHPPPGTEGYVPVPIKPNTKLSANTISSALSSHGYGNNGYANGNSTPTPAPSELSSELPLPPPPSPTQLQLLQYETEEAPPTQQTTQQQPQQQQHTRTNSSLSSISSGSSSGVGSGSAALSPNSLVASSASNLSLDLESTRSPAHSRQASGSCNSLDAMPTTPPLPPPPAPAAQNENDMNTQNKNHNAYNQLLKQYSNKLQQQQQSNTNRHNNTAKPFATAAQQPHVAALTATLANQLKFNSHQAANAAAAAAATNEVDNTPLNMADEQSAAAIYGDAAAAAAACAMPCMQTSSMSAGQDQPFEYVTLTGNVIRSVQPPGKGANASYKVNQGYVRPFGAQSAPKSPVPMASYPPQQQQQQSPRAAAGANAYATLPRSNVGQQVQSTSYTSHASSVNTSSLKCDAHELIEEIADELEHSEVLFPPPSPLSHLKGSKAVQSGLHKADTIPKYQRNWTSLPTQSPIRTPEPQEWRDNLPLAFVGVPATAQAPAQAAGAAQPNANTVHRPIAKLNGAQVSAPTQVVVTPASVPIIIEDRSGPVTMAFQSLDAYECADQAQTPVRPYTPCSSLTNKPAPIIPFYQTAEKLCFEECSATHARDYNQGAASPFPDRARSPAPGPPPNPLAAIRAPRMKEPETALLTANRLQTGSITTGQSYQGQLLAHSEQSSQSASQSYTQQPERVSERQLGNMHIQQREQSSQLQQQQQAQSQSQTKTQVGNMQIERRRKVTEEFERTQSAKTIEIRSSSSSAKASIQSQSQIAAQQQQQMQQQQSEASERRLSYGKTGYVANQARRLSEMEQEISSLTSQSQSISARASGLSEGGCFPNLRSPTFDSKFPLKPASPSVEIAQTNKLLGPPPGFVQQQQQQKSAFSKAGGYTQQLRSAGAASSSVASSVTSATSSFATATATKASSAITTTTNNQACAAYRGSQAAKLPAFNNNGSRSNASLAATAAIAAAVTPTAPAPAPASFPPNLADLQLDSNVDGSTGAGGKGGAFGATSAPKRGRGILNKAAGPGVRIPLCNSCNVQIRGPFITALGRIWCPDHFICVNGNCRRPLQDIGFVEEKGDLYCEYCFEKFLAPTCSKCAGKIKGDCLNAIGKHFHPECFTCGQCGKVFGNTPFFLEDGNAYCEADWNELFTTKCFACGFPVEAGDRWVEALNHNYHSQCFNCTYCKQNLEGQSFYNKGGRPFCKNHAR